MRKLLTNITVFSLILLAVCIAINAYLSTNNDDPAHYSLQYEEALNPSIEYNGIIIGNSKATHSIRPTLLQIDGTKFYNYAINGSTPKFYQEWFRSVFKEKIQKIDLIIVSVDLDFVRGLGRREIIKDSEYFTKPVFYDFLTRHKSEIKPLMSNRFPLIKYRKSLLDPKGVSAPWHFIKEEYDHGYISLNRTDSFDFNQKPKNKKSSSQGWKKEFKALVNLLSSSNAEIVFIIPPTYKFDAKSYQESLTYVSEFAEDRNIRLYDFNADHYKGQLNKKENFCDFVHLNSKGSLVFTEVLKNTIFQLNL